MAQIAKTMDRCNYYVRDSHAGHFVGGRVTFARVTPLSVTAGLFSTLVILLKLGFSNSCSKREKISHKLRQKNLIMRNCSSARVSSTPSHHPAHQPGPLSLVQECRGLALLCSRDVATPALLCQKEPLHWGVFCLLLAGSLWHKR